MPQPTQPSSQLDYRGKDDAPPALKPRTISAAIALLAAGVSLANDLSLWRHSVGDGPSILMSVCAVTVCAAISILFGSVTMRTNRKNRIYIGVAAIMMSVGSLVWLCVMIMGALSDLHGRLPIG
jgi:hypothetical protein